MGEETGRVPDGTGLSSSTEPQSSQGLGPSGFDPSRVRAWLVAMTRQGEDSIWRGAEKALACFDALTADNEKLRKEADFLLHVNSVTGDKDAALEEAAEVALSFDSCGPDTDPHHFIPCEIADAIRARKGPAA